MRVLLVSPHADDICLSVGALVSEMTACKSLVTVFSTSAWVEPTWDGPNDPEAVTAVRGREDRTYCSARGLDYRALGLEDSAVRHSLGGNLRRRSGHEEGLVRTTSQAIRRLVDEGEYDVVFAPLGLGAHTDHEVCRRAVGALRDSGVGLVYYEDLPYATEMSARRIERRARRADRAARPLLCATAVSVAAKLADATLYESQRKEAIFDAVKAHSERLAGLAGRGEGSGVVERVWTALPVADVSRMLGARVLVTEAPLTAPARVLAALAWGR